MSPAFLDAWDSQDHPDKMARVVKLASLVRQETMVSQEQEDPLVPLDQEEAPVCPERTELVANPVPRVITAWTVLQENKAPRVSQAPRV